MRLIIRISRKSKPTRRSFRQISVSDFLSGKTPVFSRRRGDFSIAALQVFYSRTIVDPDIAAKLTGKIGKTSFGFLALPTKRREITTKKTATIRRFDRASTNFWTKTRFSAVLRVKRDFGKENNVGFFGTARGFPEQRNFLGGFDGRLS
jgi:hypothetical protein